VDKDPVVLSREIMDIVSGLRYLVRQEVRPKMPGPQLRGPQIEVLRLVTDNPGITVSAAAKAMHLAPNSVSTLVNQLADLGMLSRTTPDNDRRVVNLNVTKLAVDWLDVTRTARAHFIRSGFAELPEADREAIANALPALRSLLANLEQNFSQWRDDD
jgi:DNA-binding MarR family transcriptional regulator